jgi:DNA repair protein SbcD/Mre11
MLKVAHLSDLHYGNGALLVEADRCTSFAVDEAIRREVDCVVITGDATDHALDIHCPAVEALAKNVRRLADHCPVLMLQGTYSHEPPGTLNVFRLLGGRYSVHVADRIKQVALLSDRTWIESEGWQFGETPAGALGIFSCIPTVNKATVAAAVGAAGAAEAVGDQMAILLRGFRSGHSAARELGIPTILLSHGTVTGCTTEHGVPMAGLDHEFTTGSLFAAGATAAMLGHIHLHQAWEEQGRWIAFAGSIARLHYGELGDKGFLSWNVAADAATFEQVATPAKRTIDLTFEGAPDMAEIERVAGQAETEGAFVRVTWTVNAEDSHAIDREAIERLLSGATEVKLVGRVVPVVTSRAEGISKAGSMAEKVQVWASATGVDAAPLLGCLEALASETPEQIAARILSGDAPAGDVSVEDGLQAANVAATPGESTNTRSHLSPIAPRIDSETLSLFGA